MSDVMAVPTDAVWPVAGRSLLFPVFPAPGETLPGYLLRNAENNLLPSIRPILELAGVGVPLGGSCLANLSRHADQLAGTFPLSSTEWSALWGVQPEECGRRRLGNVWLTPELIDSSTRRVPRTHRPGEPDQALWMVRHLGFCPRTWEMLITRCPAEGCGSPLLWGSTGALHLCGRCGASVSQARRCSIPAKLRPSLQWLVALFSEDQEEVDRAMVALPPRFESETPTDAYELVVGLARPLRAFDKAAYSAGNATLSVAEMSRACRFLLDFPRSHWDFGQHEPAMLQTFRERLENLLRCPHRPAVRADITSILYYGRPAKAQMQVRVDEWPWLSTTHTAGRLGIPRSDVARLVQAKLLRAESPTGGQCRVHRAFRKDLVERLYEEFRAQISLREFSARTGLPQLAVEQLLACGLLGETKSAAVKLVFSSAYLDRESGDALVEMITAKVCAGGGEERIPLRQVMMGVGGRPKPWARVIQAALCDGVPGGLAGSRDQRLVDLTVHAVTARQLVMGGPEGGRVFAFQPGDLPGQERSELAPSEVEDHLNCTAQDVSWLRMRKFLSPIPQAGERTRYAWEDVQALGRRLITTREIAARKGLLAGDVWSELAPVSEGGAFGQGFYQRSLIEPWLDG